MRDVFRRPQGSRSRISTPSGTAKRRPRSLKPKGGPFRDRKSAKPKANGKRGPIPLFSSFRVTGDLTHSVVNFPGALYLCPEADSLARQILKWGRRLSRKGMSSEELGATALWFVGRPASVRPTLPVDHSGQRKRLRKASGILEGRHRAIEGPTRKGAETSSDARCRASALRENWKGPTGFEPGGNRLFFIFWRRRPTRGFARFVRGRLRARNRHC